MQARAVHLHWQACLAKLLPVLWTPGIELVMTLLCQWSCFMVATQATKRQVVAECIDTFAPWTLASTQSNASLDPGSSRCPLLMLASSGTVQSLRLGSVTYWLLFLTAVCDAKALDHAGTMRRCRECRGAWMALWMSCSPTPAPSLWLLRRLAWTTSPSTATKKPTGGCTHTLPKAVCNFF